MTSAFSDYIVYVDESGDHGVVSFATIRSGTLSHEGLA